ncbi:MAG: hypothetical protein HY691_16685, partial [Chloroflexi bacterium]|nr:hypothetical protein [Chloroflexota bacterium]
MVDEGARVGLLASIAGPEPAGEGVTRSTDLAVGGLGLRLAGELPPLAPDWAAFRCPLGQPAALALTLRYAAPPPPPSRSPLAGGDLWRLWADGDYRRLATYLNGRHRRPDRLLRCDAAWAHGELLVDPDARDAQPLAYPLDQLIWLHLLARHGGALLHAAGVALGDRGIALVGHSGAGKSTLARLWLRARDATLLNDDRVVVRPASGGPLYLWSTPWHGDVATVTPAAAPLAAVFVLRHGRRTRTRQLGPAAAAAALFARAFLPLWEASAVAQAVAL